MIKLLLYLTILVSIVGPAQAADRNELKKLQAALDSAQTQADMNLASGALADYWDKELLKSERKIEKKLDSEALALFRKAKQAWRKYRSAQVTFDGDFYRGGSIQPLIRNTTFVLLTERRVNDLEQLYKEQYKQK
ncbi:MAG: hypothetical protein C0402_02435 [Thermodesulfovibrio sp.]|nr:hypothetical protein [Thermodesulfovibrio sp.]